MKKLALFLMTICLFISCSQDPNILTEDQDSIPKDEYYIQYAVSGYAVYSISISTPNGQYRTGFSHIDSQKTSSWSEIYGPVERGFTATISATGKSSTKKPLKVTIHVSKNGAPFTLKGSAGGPYSTGTSVGTSYTIDF